MASRATQLAPDATGPTWEDIASWYDDFVTRGSGPHETAVECTLDLCGDVRGRHVLDVACGQGLAARALAARGPASTTGIDSSRQLIARARQHEREHPLGIRYLVADARSLRPVAAASVDLAVCQLALMDISDLDRTLRAVRRVLVPGGHFVAVIGHPAFLAPRARPAPGPDGRPGILVQEYLTETFWRSGNPNGVRRVGNFHRPISTYLNAMLAAGLRIDRTAEPRASRRLAQEAPIYGEVPIFFAVRAVATEMGRNGGQQCTRS